MSDVRHHLAVLQVSQDLVLPLDLGHLVPQLAADCLDGGLQLRHCSGLCLVLN